MTFKPGQSGNPKGRTTERAVEGAIRAAVNATNPKSGRAKLLDIAEVIADLALAGEAWACNMIADRLDGKPAQESTVRFTNEIDRMNEPELRDFIRRELEASRLGGGEDTQSPHSGVTH